MQEIEDSSVPLVRRMFKRMTEDLPKKKEHCDMGKFLL